MLEQAFKAFKNIDAVGTVALRIGVVGLNFSVMIWLTYTLGLGAFGALIFVWGSALVGSAVVSCGGPLVLLRALSDGSGLRLTQICLIALIMPAIMCLSLLLIAQWIMPDPRWAAVFLVAFCANFLACLASIMRSLASVQLSMMLRDAAPFAALGLAAILSPSNDAVPLLWTASAVMTGFGAMAVVWCVLNIRASAHKAQPSGAWWSWSLWGTAVLGMIIVQMDLIIGGILMSPQAVGLYAFLRRIANVVALPVTVANWVSARPVAAAYGAGNHAALKQASARGNRIAWYPAMAIAALCLLGLWGGAQTAYIDVTAEIAICFGILIFGALAQSFMASGFTVATLSDHAKLAAASRAITMVLYAILAVVIGADMDPVNNAIIYTLAMCIGNGLVWLFLLRDLDVDTSALVLLDREVRQWRAS